MNNTATQDGSHCDTLRRSFSLLERYGGTKGKQNGTAVQRRTFPLRCLFALCTSLLPLCRRCAVSALCCLVCVSVFARFTYIFNFWFSTFFAFILFSSRPLTLKHRRAFAHLQHGDCNQTRPQHNRPMYLTYFHPLLCDSAVGDIAPSARCASMAAAEAASCGHCTTNSSTTG